MILPAACSAIVTQFTTLCSPVLALCAVSNPWILDTTLDERPNNLSLLQCLDACHVHLNTIVKLTAWLHGVRSGLTTQAQRPGARDAMIANHGAMPGSLQRMVSRLVEPHK
jgi:hypothetical protein